MGIEDDLRYAQERMRAHGMHGFAGNRRAETSSEAQTRGPTMLEIALVNKLGGRVVLSASDFQDVREYVVHRTEDKSNDTVILEARRKTDPRERTIDLERQPDGGYGEDRYGGL